MNKFYCAGAWALTSRGICQYEKKNLKSLFQKYTQCSHRQFPLTKVQEQQQQARLPSSGLSQCVV